MKGLIVTWLMKWTFQPTLMSPLLRACNLDRLKKNMRWIQMCLCVHMHASKCHFWTTFSHFPLNFISSVSDKWDCRLTTLFPMPGGVCGHCSSFWRQQSCRWLTTPLIPLRFLSRPRRSLQFASLLLSCMSPCQERRKRRESRGSIKSKKRVFPLCSFAWQKANIQSESMTEEAAYLFQYVHYLWWRWHLRFCFSLFGHDEMQDCCYW